MKLSIINQKRILSINLSDSKGFIIILINSKGFIIILIIK